NLLFVPDTRGYLRAYDATSGQEIWKANNGIGHNGGIISYQAGGKQYVAVMTGWGSLVGDEYAGLYGEPYASMAKDSGAIVVYSPPEDGRWRATRMARPPCQQQQNSTFCV